MSVINPVTNEFNLTPRVKKSYKDAQAYAAFLGHQITNNSHILYGCLLNAPEGFWTLIASEKIPLTVDVLTNIIESYAAECPDLFFGETEEWHSEVYDAMEVAEKLKEEVDQYIVGIEHVILAILQKSPDIGEYLNGSDVDNFYLQDVLYEAVQAGYKVESSSEGPSDISVEENKAQQTLHKYATSLNYLYFQDKLPEIYGRDKEISELIEILSKKNKSNAIIIGESGVGKTAIVEGLTRRMTDAKKIPCSLMGHEVFQVDLGSMIAGTRYRGEFEEKFDELIKAAELVPNCILFFDEIHNLFGAGNPDGSLDASNMLKPALARGAIKCIGATTTTEYKKIFEKDGAMKRRFEAITIEEPSLDEVKHMIKECSPKYSDFHYVEYSDAILNLIVDLAERYLPHRRFPDKAFDIIDQVGAKVKIKNTELPEEIFNKHAKINAFLADHAEGDEPTLDYGKGHDLLSDYMEALREFYDELTEAKEKVTVSDVIEIIAEKGGLSPKAITTKKGGFNLFLKNMKSEVFGQDEHLEKVNSVLACAKAGLNEENKPLCSLLFVGATSVGKTFTAKKIAKYFFDNEKAFLQINMSEYQDKGSISKLIGTSAGFVGYEDGGLLTDFVGKSPNAVILFDEIEKANPKVLDILLHILDEGYVNDNLNRKIDFSNTVVILTTNIGHAEQAQRSVGFLDDAESANDSYTKSIKKQLRPELVARINDIIVFNSLTDAEFKLIIRRELNLIQSKLQKRNIDFKFAKVAVDTILSKAQSEGAHARNIKEFVKQSVQVPVAKRIVSSPNIKQISLKVVDKLIKIE